MDRRLFENYVSSIFGKIHSLDRKEYETALTYFDQYFIEYLPNEKRSHICDVGCGAGFFLYYLKMKGYTNVFGVDISSQQIEQCKTMNLPNVELDDSVAYLRKNPDRFDAIYCSNVLEHLEDDKIIELLSAMFDALKRDGLVYLIVPNAAPTFGNFILYFDFTHKRLFTPISLRQVMNIAGFASPDVKEIQPQGKSLTGLIRKYLYKLYTLFYSLTFIVQFGLEGYKRFRPVCFSSVIVGIAKR